MLAPRPHSTGTAHTMQESFDPYSAWLGLPPMPQPPNHYVLLGLARFEMNPQFIEQAYERQSAKVAPHLQGPQASAAGQLLSELTLARLCLLDPQRRREYNTHLTQSYAAPAPLPPAAHPTQATPPEQPAAPAPAQTVDPEPPRADAPAPPVAPPAPPVAAPTAPQEPAAANNESSIPRFQLPRLPKHAIEMLKIVLGGVAGILIALLILRFIQREPAAPSEEAPPTVAQRPEQNDIAHAPREREVAPPATAAPNSTAAEVPRPAPPLPQNQSAPTENRQTASRAERRQQLATASPAELLAAGQSSREAGDRYVLLAAAVDKAAAAGDHATALAALEALDQQFQIDRLARQTQLLATLARTRSSDLPAITLCQLSLTVARQALTAERPELANRGAQLALLFARRSESESLIRAATLLVVQTQGVLPATADPAISPLDPEL